MQHFRIRHPYIHHPHTQHLRRCHPGIRPLHRRCLHPHIHHPRIPYSRIRRPSLPYSLHILLPGSPRLHILLPGHHNILHPPLLAYKECMQLLPLYILPLYPRNLRSLHNHPHPGLLPAASLPALLHHPMQNLLLPHTPNPHSTGAVLYLPFYAKTAFSSISFLFCSTFLFC